MKPELIEHRDGESYSLKFVNYYTKFLSAIQQAHGSVEAFSIPRLKEMSALDLLGTFCKNDIYMRHQR